MYRLRVVRRNTAVIGFRRGVTRYSCDICKRVDDHSASYVFSYTSYVRKTKYKICENDNEKKMQSSLSAMAAIWRLEIATENLAQIHSRTGIFTLIAVCETVGGPLIFCSRLFIFIPLFNITRPRDFRFCDI